MQVEKSLGKSCFIKAADEKDKLHRLKKTWSIRVKSGYKSRVLKRAW